VLDELLGGKTVDGIAVATGALGKIGEDLFPVLARIRSGSQPPDARIWARPPSTSATVAAQQCLNLRDMRTHAREAQGLLPHPRTARKAGAEPRRPGAICSNVAMAEA
jgi:hypothetical protein